MIILTSIPNWTKIETIVNRIWTRDRKEFRGEIDWTKIEFSKQVHHVRMNSLNTFLDQKRTPAYLYTLGQNFRLF